MKMCDYYLDETSMCGVLIELCPFHNHYRNWIPRNEMCRYAKENLTKKTDVDFKLKILEYVGIV